MSGLFSCIDLCGIILGMSEQIETTKLDSLTPDIKNANRGTDRGAGMLKKSLHKLGAGRSILLDKNGRIIAGNKTAEAAMSIGLEDVVIVRTTGDKLVAVLREDLDLTDDTGTARQLAYADNRIGAVSLDFDPDIIAGDLSMGLDLSDWFHDWELEHFTHEPIPTLDELEAEYGEPGERDFWPYIRVQVSPETMQRWNDLMGSITETSDEAKKVEIILGRL